MKVTSTKLTSVGWGQGSAPKDPVRPLRPLTGMPDRVNADDRAADGVDTMKAGISNTGTVKHNPGR